MPSISNVRFFPAPSMRKVLFLYQLQLKSVMALMIPWYLGQNVPSDISFEMVDEFPEVQRHVSIIIPQTQHHQWYLAYSGLSEKVKGKDQVLALPQTAETS